MDPRRARRLLISALLVAGVSAIYLFALEQAPRYLGHDEIIYSLNGESIAATGQDLNGRFLPMYIEYPPRFGRPTWDQPMLIYALAATLKLLPVSEFAIRLPMAIAALVDVLLLYLIARTIFESTWLGIAAAVLLATTPAHVMHGRMATDFQLWLPFALGWMWCLVRYVRTGAPRLLFASGVLLGVGIYGYVAAYLFMPISAIITAAVLLRRRDPTSRYGVLLAGIVLPTIVCLPWMLRSPLPFRDILAHYAVVGPEANQPAVKGLDQNVWNRLAEIPRLYASFFDPQFLFVNGPIRTRATQLVGVLLLPMAGLLAVGVVRAIRRRTTDDVLMLAGFLTASLPASFAGEGQAIWRALTLTPFAALLAVSALEQVSSASTRATRAAIVAAFALTAIVAAGYHEFLPHAQALVRASTIPLVVLGLAVLFGDDAIARTPIAQVAAIGATTLVAMHAAYIVSNQATPIAVVVLALVSSAALLAGTPDWLRQRPRVAVALLALAVGHFLYIYVDYGPMPRIGPLPASLLILGLRLIVAATTCAVVVWIARVRASRPDGSNDRRGIAILSISLIVLQLAYYAVDTFTDYRLRAIHAAIVVVAGFSVAFYSRTRANGGRTMMGTLAVAGLAGIAVIHFSSFMTDYFTAGQVRGSADQEGNARIAFERVIDRTARRNVPAIFLGRIGPYPGGDLYWRFYVLKHHREELLARTMPVLDFPIDRIRALPGGSIIVTSPSGDINASIDDLSKRGELQTRELIKAPDGSPIFWILETRAH